MYDLDNWEGVFPGGCYVVFEDEHDEIKAKSRILS